MKMHGMESFKIQLHSFLNSVLGGGDRSRSHPGHCTSRKQPGGLYTQSGDFGKEINLLSLPAHSLVTTMTKLSQCPLSPTYPYTYIHVSCLIEACLFLLYLITETQLHSKIMS